MKLRVLGSASGVPMPGRYNEAVLVGVGDASYLLDAGEPCAATIHNSNVSIYSIKSVFISHSHADHVGGLPMLLQVAWLWQSRGPEFRFRPDNSLRVYLPAHSVAPLRQYLESLQMGDGRLPFKLLLEEIREGPIYRDERVAVSAHATSHLGRDRIDDEGRPHGHRAYSFVLEAEGKRVVYSGDLGSPADIAGLANGADGKRCDAVIVECAHFPPERLFAELPLERIKRVIVNHIHPSLCGDDRKIFAGLKDARGCDVVVAHDNLEVEV